VARTGFASTNCVLKKSLPYFLEYVKITEEGEDFKCCLMFKMKIYMEADKTMMTHASKMVKKGYDIRCQEQPEEDETHKMDRTSPRSPQMERNC
jgi:hypothetical protein